MLARRTKSRRERRLLQEINRVQKELQPIGTWRVQDYGGDVVDQVNHTVELFNSEAWFRFCQKRLEQLEHAQARLGTGRYGVCELCGNEIAPARMKVMPSATLCVDCQRQSERQNHHDCLALHRSVPADQRR